MTNPMERTNSIATTEGLLSVRDDFPILHQTLYDNKPLVYLDSAATSQKPSVVIKAIREYFEEDNANVHRGIHALAHRATLAYEGARLIIKNHINASSTKEVIYTSGTTDGINLVAATWGMANLGRDDAIILSEMEHHSNLIPWQLLREKTGVEIRYIPFTDDGELDLDAFQRLLDDKVKLVAVTHMSNVFGTINPVAEIINLAHAAGSLVLLDGAQAAAHMTIDVTALDVDFYVFSGHKMMGPTGIGILYAKQELLEEMPPYRGGGEMIQLVELDHFTTADLPQKFEAGTPNIAGAIALGTAIDYMNELGLKNIRRHEELIDVYARERLLAIKGVKIYGNAVHRGAVIPFNVESIHPHDLSQFLDQQGVAVRSGHHCAQPLLKKIGVNSTSRASFYVYNDFADVDRLAEAIIYTQKFFS